jgi:hypothetical protein
MSYVVSYDPPFNCVQFESLKLAKEFYNELLQIDHLDLIILEKMPDNNLNNSYALYEKNNLKWNKNNIIHKINTNPQNNKEKTINKQIENILNKNKNKN